jgi:type II secretory pathway pseudopilin PulG
MDGSLALMIVLVVVAVLSFVAGIVWLTTEHQRKMAQIKERNNQGANPEI